MHLSAYNHARMFFEQYWQPHYTDVVELGSQNVNGTLRDHAPRHARYVGLDMAPANGVDVIVTPGQPFPFPDASFDVALTSSAFEHDVCFWETFVDLIRILRPGGLLYVNAPSNHAFHRFPLDCWRFYPDAGHGLVTWAARREVTVELVESFVAKPDQGWADFVGVFRKPSDRPLVRRGRIADLAEAMNIFDGARGGGASGVEVERESAATFDMLAYDAVARRNAELTRRVEQLSEELQSLRAGLVSPTGIEPVSES